MRYAEAIREGIKLLPHQVFRMAGDIWTGEGCVHMTACYAAGINYFRVDPIWLYGKFPELKGIDVACPCEHCCLMGHYEVYAIAVHLNDTHQWTREAIADWVDQVVPPPAPEPPPLIALMDQLVKEEERELALALRSQAHCQSR